MAMDILGITSTEVGVERVFSIGRDMIDYRRNRLNGDTIAALIVLRCWWGPGGTKSQLQNQSSAQKEPQHSQVNSNDVVSRSAAEIETEADNIDASRDSPTPGSPESSPEIHPVFEFVNEDLDFEHHNLTYLSDECNPESDIDQNEETSDNLVRDQDADDQED